MKLVIDIPEDCYRYIKELQSLVMAKGTCKTIQKDVIDAIKNGIPYEERPTGGRIVPDTLQGWRYEEQPTCGHVVPDVLQGWKYQEEKSE